MAEKSAIEWTDATLNPWIGCQHVSPGCDHCYVETQNGFRKWTAEGGWGPHAERRRTSPANWKNPQRWNAKAAEFARERGRRRRVFCASLADVFDNQVPRAWRADLFRLIRETPELDWQLLTKRPQNIGAMLPSDWGDHGYANVWLGTTTEDQEEHDRRWPILARVPAALRFVSYEPALGPLTLRASNGRLPDWLICGGESGPHARPMDRAWVIDVRNQCIAAGVAFFFKQWGGRSPKSGGRLLEGREWSQFPKTCGAPHSKNCRAAHER
jgi:protein gp37